MPDQRPFNIGLCGAHRTGKTTLARVISQRAPLTSLETHTSQIFNAGASPTMPMSFAARLKVQKRILETYEDLFQAQEGDFISDRTPIDLIAYTLADVSSATETDFPALDLYLNRCFKVTNDFFEQIVLIQPGIPLVSAPDKARLNPAYIEHLNSLMMGLCYDSRNSASVLVLHRALTTVENRARFIIRNWTWSSCRVPTLKTEVA